MCNFAQKKKEKFVSTRAQWAHTTFCSDHFSGFPATPQRQRSFVLESIWFGIKLLYSGMVFLRFLARRATSRACFVTAPSNAPPDKYESFPLFHRHGGRLPVFHDCTSPKSQDPDLGDPGLDGFPLFSPLFSPAVHEKSARH